MLKFRRTISIKARRAAEQRKKAMEDKVKMEWAWMPLAAVMNEKATDLVYWVPPLYTSRSITNNSSHISNKSVTYKDSFRQMSSRSSTLKSFEGYNLPNLPKKKLCKRRSKLHATRSTLDEMEPDLDHGKYLQRQEALESQSLEVQESRSDSDKSADESLIPFPEVRNINSFKKTRKTKKRSFKRKPKKSQVCNLLKLLEKLSNICNKKSSTKYLIRKKNTNKSKIFKRPSVKIYSSQFQYLPCKSEYPYCANTTHTRKKSIRINPYKKYFSHKSKSTNFDNNSSKNTNDNNFKGKEAIHFEMALRMLSNYFNKKFQIQTSEIEIMKHKLQKQETMLKEAVQLSLQVKSQITTINDRLDNIEYIGSTFCKQEDTVTPYIALQSLNEEYNTSGDSCTESYDESFSFSQSSSYCGQKVKCNFPNPKIYTPHHSKDSTESTDFPEKYRTTIKLQLNGNSIGD